MPGATTIKDLQGTIEEAQYDKSAAYSVSGSERRKEPARWNNTKLILQYNVEKLQYEKMIMCLSKIS